MSAPVFLHEHDEFPAALGIVAAERSRFATTLPPVMRPHVQLEVGSARVTPGEPRRITSWLHHLVEDQGRLGNEFIANVRHFEDAHHIIEMLGGMFWGPRVPVAVCADSIRGFLTELSRVAPPTA